MSTLCHHLSTKQATKTTVVCQHCHKTANTESWFDECGKLVKYIRTW